MALHKRHYRGYWMNVNTNMAYSNQFKSQAHSKLQTELKVNKGEWASLKQRLPVSRTFKEGSRVEKLWIYNVIFPTLRSQSFFLLSDFTSKWYKVWIIRIKIYYFDDSIYFLPRSLGRILVLWYPGLLMILRKYS